MDSAFVQIRMRGAGSRLCALTLGLVAIALPVHAQVAPDAGTTLRELRPRALQLPQTAPPTLDAPLPSPAGDAPGELRFRVDAYDFTGVSVFTAAELADVVSDLTGQSLTLAEVQAAARRITRHYRDRGYLVARAYVPPQEIRDSRVEIALLEGRYGQPELDNRSPVRDEVLEHHLARITANRVIERSQLDRRLLLIRDLGGVDEVNATLRPGAATGESTLRVEISAPPRLTGGITADNYGNRFIGRYRLGGSVDLASPLGLGDQLHVRVLTSGDELQSGMMGYRLPLGVDGLTLQASFMAVRYELGDEFAALDASGSAYLPSVALSYPVIRAPRLNVYARGGADFTSLRDDTGRPRTSADRSLWSVFGGAYGDWRDELGGSSVSAFSVNIEAGELDIHSRTLALIDAATNRTAGAYQKLTYSLLRLQPVRGPVSLSLGLNGQFALQILDSAEKMWLGGATGVRAYPQGEAAGDDGYLANVELRWQLPALSGLAPVLLAFVDTGGVQPDRDRLRPGDDWRFLSGTGIGMTLAERHGFELNAAWAWQIGPEDAQADKDRSGRGWILIGKTF
jgi:hemolysin activation/secretion protein